MIIDILKPIPIRDSDFTQTFDGNSRGSLCVATNIDTDTDNDTDIDTENHLAEGVGGGAHHRVWLPSVDHTLECDILMWKYPRFQNGPTLSYLAG